MHWIEEGLLRCCYGLELSHHLSKGGVLLRVGPHSGETGAINQSSTSQLLPVFMLQFLLISSCFLHTAALTFQRLFPPHTLTIIVFPSSTAERANRERGRERKSGWEEISNTAVPLPPGLSGHSVGVIYSKVYSVHGDKMKTNRALTKVRKTFWNLLSLHEVLFYCLTGSLEKQISTEPTAWPSVCLYVCLSVCLSVYHRC